MESYSIACGHFVTTSGMKTTSETVSVTLNHVNVGTGSLDVGPHRDSFAIPATILCYSLSCYVMAVDLFVLVASAFQVEMVKAV